MVLEVFTSLGIIILSAVALYLYVRDLRTQVATLEQENARIRQQFQTWMQSLDEVTRRTVEQHRNQSRPLRSPPAGLLPTMQRARLIAEGDCYSVAVGWDELRGNPDVVAVSLDNRNPYFCGHIAITGETGAGKSTLAFLILAQLATNLTTSQVQLFCIDPKRDSVLWRGKAHNWREPVLGRNPVQIAAAMQQLREEREAREQLLEDHAVLEYDDLPLTIRPPLLVVYVAELDVLKLGSARLDDWLTAELGTARAAGIRYILDFQNASGKETSWRTHIGFYIAGTQHTQDAVKPNIGMSAAELRSKGAIPMHELEGTGYFTVRLGQTVKSVRTPHITLEQRKAALALLPSAPRPAVLDFGAQADADQPVRDAAEATDGEAPASVKVTPEERRTIIDAARHLRSRSEVCRSVFQAAPGGDAYQKVKLVCDEEGLLLPSRAGKVA